MQVQSHRIKQVNELVRHELSALLLREFTVPPGCLITITAVATSKDLGYATITVSILPEHNQHDILTGLQKKAGMFSFLLGKAIILRKIPKLRFQLDTREAHAAHIDKLLDKIQQER